MAGHKDLIVWQKADQLAVEVYQITKDFPKDEVYGLTSQLRRVAVSIPTNIVEGNAKHSKAEFGRFLEISRGSLVETEYLLSLAKQLNYIKRDTSTVDQLISQVDSLLWSLHKSTIKK